jgi:hypothetical protein
MFSKSMSVAVAGVALLSSNAAMMPVVLIANSRQIYFTIGVDR